MSLKRSTEYRGKKYCRIEKTKNLFYLDAIIHHERTPEERESLIEELTEKSDKLTEWIEM